MVAGVAETSTKTSFTFIDLTVIFIIRLFGAFRVPKMRVFAVKKIEHRFKGVKTGYHVLNVPDKVKKSFLDCRSPNNFKPTV